MNEHQRRQQELQAASRRFLQALSAGQVHVFDRFQNTIEPGCKVVYQTPEAPLCDVISIQPVLDPNVPPGLLDVTMTTTIKVRVQGNGRLSGSIMVGPPPDAKPLGGSPAEGTGLEDGPGKPDLTERHDPSPATSTGDEPPKEPSKIQLVDR